MEQAEFQVVILSGGQGSRMYPLSTEIAKPMLPIANRPMISYQLELLERNGFTEAIVLAQESAASELKTFFVEIYKGKIKVDWHFLPDFMGTAEALLRIKNKLKSDFIVISGDLIVDDRFLHSMADMHRVQDATFTALLTPRREDENEQAASKTSKHNNDFGLVDYIGFAPDNARLLYFKAAADVENTMKINKQLLLNHPNITIHTDLVDAHFYIFSKVVMRILEKNIDTILSIKGELIPYLVAAQFKADAKDTQIQRPQHTAYSMTTSGVDSEDTIRCFGYLMRDGYCARSNTINTYMQMNLAVATRGACYQPLEPLVNHSFIHPLADVSRQTQIAVDCVVGQGTKIGEKCSIKKSVIGKHCVIDDKVKIINSVIMNHVTISAGCVINGSVICNNVHMKPGCSIKDSQIGVAYHVPERAEIKNETLCVETDSGWMDI